MFIYKIFLYINIYFTYVFYAHFNHSLFPNFTLYAKYPMQVSISIIFLILNSCLAKVTPLEVAELKFILSSW